LLDQLLDAIRGSFVGGVSADPPVARDLFVKLFALSAHGVPAQ
jgi:hypothetical protein